MPAPIGACVGAGDNVQSETDDQWRSVAAAQGGGSDPSAFWDWLECPFYDGLCLRLSEGHRMFLGAVASLQHNGLTGKPAIENYLNRC